MKKIMFIIFLIMLLPCVLASSRFEDFTAFTEHNTINICEAAQHSYDITITNSGLTASSYEIKLDGSAAKYAQVLPAGMMATPGETVKSTVFLNVPTESKADKKLEIYITTTSGIQKIIEQDINIIRCNNVALSAGSNNITGCPAAPAVIDFVVNNTGSYVETYNIYVDDIPEWINTTTNHLTLASGDSAGFSLYFTTPVDKYGVYSTNVIVEGEKSGMAATMPINFNIDPCYEFELKADEFFGCDAAAYNIPIKLENTADINNFYEVELLNAPRWAKLDVKEFNVSGNDAAVFNIMIETKEHMEEDHNFTVVAKEQYADITHEVSIPVSINECFELDMTVINPKNVVCAAETAVLPVNVTNLGIYDDTVKVVGTGIADAEDVITIGKDESDIAELEFIVPSDVTRGKMYVDAFTVGNEWNKVNGKAKFKVVPRYKCFMPEVDVEDKIKIVEGTSRAIPVVVSNDGIRSAEYEIVADSDLLIEAEDDDLELEPGMSDVIYLTAYAGVDIGEFEANVYLVKDEILYKKSLNIEVVPASTVDEDAGEEPIVDDDNAFIDWLKTYGYYIIAGFVILAILIIVLKVFGKD